MGLSGCSSQKKLERKAPFTLGPASYQEWTGGIEEDISGRTVRIPIAHLKGDILFKTLFFRGRSAELQTERVNDQMFVLAKFEDPKMLKPDIIMHADPKREVGNQPPILNVGNRAEIPFELERDQAVMSYLENGLEKFIKIYGIEERPGQIY